MSTVQLKDYITGNYDIDEAILDEKTMFNRDVRICEMSRDGRGGEMIENADHGVKNHTHIRQAKTRKILASPEERKQRTTFSIDGCIHVKLF